MLRNERVSSETHVKTRSAPGLGHYHTKLAKRSVETDTRQSDTPTRARAMSPSAPRPQIFCHVIFACCTMCVGLGYGVGLVSDDTRHRSRPPHSQNTRLVRSETTHASVKRDCLSVFEPYTVSPVHIHVARCTWAWLYVFWFNRAAATTIRNRNKA